MAILLTEEIKGTKKYTNYFNKKLFCRKLKKKE